MNQQTKHRIIGGVVLAGVVAIFLPVLFHHSEPSSKVQLSENIPAQPVSPKVSLQLPKQATQEQKEQPAAMLTSAEQKPEIKTVKRAKVETLPTSTDVIKAKPAASKSAAATKTAVVKAKTTANKVNVTTKPVTLTLWAVQLASLSNDQNANRLIKKLQKQGYNAYSRKTVTASGNVITRVLIGPENKKSTIERIQKEVQAKFKIKGLIRRYVA